MLIHLVMRMVQVQKLTLTLAQRMRQEGRELVGSVLPRTRAALESGDHDDVLRMLRDLDVMGRDVQWRSVTDWFLCLMVPAEREGDPWAS